MSADTNDLELPGGARRRIVGAKQECICSKHCRSRNHGRVGEEVASGNIRPFHWDILSLVMRFVE
jgi:hypothetical protein